MKNLQITLSVLLTFFISQSLSAQFFSKFEYADSMNKSNMELSSHYGQWRIATAYGGGKVADVYGLKFAYGIADQIDARVAVQRIMSSDLGSITAIGISPKISLANQRIALIPSFTYALSEDIGELFVNPAVIVDVIQKENFSLNFGINYLLPIQDAESGELAINLGANINLSQSIYLRPKIQLFSPFSEEVVQYIPGIEFAYRIDQKSDQLNHSEGQ